MTMILSAKPLLILAAAMTISAAPAERPLPVHVGGRVIREADGSARFGWPGVYFEGRFSGPSVRVRAEAPEDFLRLLVDGQEKKRFERAGRIDLVVNGLGRGPHVVRVEKMTESQQGGSRFIGFFAPAGTRPLPAPERRRTIEFIGDSYTVGYGNLSPSQSCTERQVHDLTDTQQGFAALVAKRYGADVRINAYSGFGVVRNYAGSSPELNLPSIYPRLKPDDPTKLERIGSGWRPQIIVVNLGTNDFSTPVHAGEKWADAAALHADYRRRYAEFVRGLAQKQRQARFILMGSDLFYDDVRAVAASLAASGGPKVTTVKFGGLDYSGCNGHPSVADDRKVALLLERTIDALPGAWAGR